MAAASALADQRRRARRPVVRAHDGARRAEAHVASSATTPASAGGRSPRAARGSGRWRRPTWCARRCSCSPTRWPAARRAFGPSSPSAWSQALNDGERPRGALARLDRRLGPGADGRPRARRLRRHGPGAGRGTRADQLERLRHRARRRSRWPTPRGCWTPPTWRRRSASRASPPTSRCCTRRSSARGPTPCWRARWRASASCSTGSYLWGEGAARNLQDPLTFRSAAPIQAAARRRARARLVRHWRIELNAAQGNPLVSVAGGHDPARRAVYEVVGLSAALDYVRIALASHAARGVRAQRQAAGHAVVRAADRAAPEPGGPDLGLSILAITARVAGRGGEPARPAGLVHASRAPPAPRASRTAPPTCRSRRGGWRRWSSSARRSSPSSCSSSAQAVDVRGVCAARPRHGAGHARIRRGRADACAAGDTPPGGRRARPRLLRSAVADALSV